MKPCSVRLKSKTHRSRWYRETLHDHLLPSHGRLKRPCMTTSLIKRDNVNPRPKNNETVKAYQELAESELKGGWLNELKPLCKQTSSQCDAGRRRNLEASWWWNGTCRSNVHMDNWRGAVLGFIGGRNDGKQNKFMPLKRAFTRIYEKPLLVYGLRSD